jgi:hypothetical protein
MALCKHCSTEASEQQEVIKCRFCAVLDHFVGSGGIAFWNLFLALYEFGNCIANEYKRSVRGKPCGSKAWTRFRYRMEKLSK